MKNVKKNFLYSIIYQILAVVIPMITIPYVSRKIGVTGIGSYSYTYSIAYYFMIIAMLGINNYGSREIAKQNENKISVSNCFWSIYFFQIIFSIFISIVYVLFVLLFTDNYKSLFFIQSLYVFSSVFDINWFYNGIEKIKVMVIRNSIIKFLSLILILIFVKDRNDTGIYTLILAGSTFISNIILLFYLKKNVMFIKPNLIDIKKHLKPCLTLFIPVIAMKIYKVMDKTMIGIFSNVDEVGYYSNADSIINVPMGIIIALGTVMLPRITNLLSKNKKEEASNLFIKSMKFAIFLMTPISIGLFCIGKDFSIIFFGSNFEKTGIIISILSITIFFMTIANVIRTQYLIPNHMDKEYIISIVSGAVVNVLCNIIFIKQYGAIGACIGTILAEMIVMVMSLYYYSRRNRIIILLKICKEYVISFFIVFIYLIIIGKLNYINLYLKLIVQILGSCIIYYLLNYKYVNQIINLNKILSKFRRKKA